MSLLSCFGLMSYSQSLCYEEVPCPVGHPGPICKDNIKCWSVNITNELVCDLYIFFDYKQFGSCGDIVFETIVPASAVNQLVQSYERIFIGDGCSCLCPAWMRIAEWNVPGFVPWGFQNPSNPSTPTPGAAFMDCSALPRAVYVDITNYTPTSVDMRFYY